MSDRIKSIVQAVRSTLSSHFSKGAAGVTSGLQAGSNSALISKSSRNYLLTLGLIGAVGYALYTHPPMQRIARGEVGIRI
ncbi:MAG: prohibitin family protein, partial [Pseudomonadota bacterium]